MRKILTAHAVSISPVAGFLTQKNELPHFFEGSSLHYLQDTMFSAKSQSCGAAVND
jgi:hypothetical protein